MKKVLSVLVIAAVMLSCLALAVSATESMTGKISLVSAPASDIVLTNDKKVSADVTNPLEIVPYDANGKILITAAEKDEVANMKNDAAKIDLSKLAVNTPNAKLYGFFTVELAKNITLVKANANAFGVSVSFLSSDSPVAAAAPAALKSAKVTVDVPGVTKDNSPAILRYDTASDTFSLVESTVDGSKITFNAEACEDGVGYFTVVYTPTYASPETNVTTYVFAVLFVVALAGAAFAGKKAFANK